jgi:hypothetical protein
MAPIISREPILRAAAYVRLGQIDKAKAAMQRTLKQDLGWTLEKEASFPMIERLKRPYLDDLRKAGLPES